MSALGPDFCARIDEVRVTPNNGHIATRRISPPPIETKIVAACTAAAKAA
jgi:hypothetical protein